MQSISQALQKYIENQGIKTELDIAKIWNYWSMILGPQLADLAKPLGRRKKTLIIGAKNSTIMQELNFSSQEILDKIYDFLGWQPFDNICFELLEKKTSLDQINIEQEKQLS